MPVCIILIYYLSKMKSEKQRAQVLVKALEVNPNIDVNELTKACVMPRKTPEEIRNKQLLYACLFSLIGILLIAIGIVALVHGLDIQQRQLQAFLFSSVEYRLLP